MVASRKDPILDLISLENILFYSTSVASTCSNDQYFWTWFVQDDMLQGVNLIPADPDDGCGQLYNAAVIYQSVALVKRG